MHKKHSEVAIIGVKVFHKTWKKLLSGTVKLLNKEMLRHKILLALAITRVKVFPKI